MHSWYFVGRFSSFAGCSPADWWVTTQEAAAQVCVGDCNGNRVVAINELVTGVNIALNSQSVDVCPAVDRNNSRTVSVDELVVAVKRAARLSDGHADDQLDADVERNGDEHSADLLADDQPHGDGEPHADQHSADGDGDSDGDRHSDSATADDPRRDQSRPRRARRASSSRSRSPIPD